MGTNVPATDEVSTPRWRGINHLALVTNDMDATVRFYHGTLGARLRRDDRHARTSGTTSSSSARRTRSRSSSTRTRRREPFAKPAGIPDARAPQFDHLSFNLPDEQALLDLRQRLKSADCEVTDVVDHGFIRSIYFTDPNGIALEASWWVLDATGRPADYGDSDLFADPDPVPAVRELQADGALASVPRDPPRLARTSARSRGTRRRSPRGGRGRSSLRGRRARPCTGSSRRRSMVAT